MSKFFSVISYINHENEWELFSTLYQTCLFWTRMFVKRVGLFRDFKSSKVGLFRHTNILMVVCLKRLQNCLQLLFLIYTEFKSFTNVFLYKTDFTIYTNNKVGWFGWFIVFKATFNNISVISWWSVFYSWSKLEYPEKTINLSKVTEKNFNT